MTYQQVSTMIASFGLPYAYREFPDGTEQTPPFICFFFPDSDDFKADNTNYSKIRPLSIELYTDQKDFALESQIESALSAAGLVYERGEAYISGEQMYQIAYDTEVLIE